MKRPDSIALLLEDSEDQDLIQYILWLEDRVEELNSQLEAVIKNDNPFEETYNVLKAKLRETNRALTKYTVKIEESDNKAYERYWKAMLDIKNVVSNMTWLKGQMAKVGGSEEEGKVITSNPVEMRALKQKQ